MIAGLNSSLINSVTRARTWGRTSVPSFFPQGEQLIMNPVLLRDFSKKLLSVLLKDIHYILRHGKPKFTKLNTTGRENEIWIIPE